MEQAKSILIIGLLVIVSALFVFRPSAPYEPPVFVSIPSVISDSLKERIVSDANAGYLVGTENEFAKRFGKTKWRTHRVRDSKAEDSLAGLIDSLRIHGLRIQDDSIYVSILTDSTEYRLSKRDSVLGVGFDIVIGLADTVLLEPFNAFIHERWLDSLTWHLQEKPVKKLNWIEWLREYPDRIGIIAFIFLILGIV